MIEIVFHNIFNRKMIEMFIINQIFHLKERIKELKKETKNLKKKYYVFISKEFYAHYSFN